MGKIIKIDLSNKTVVEVDRIIEGKLHYGRGLVIKLLERFTCENSGRLDIGNTIVLAPGLLTGTLAPSTGRLIVACKKGEEGGIHYSNLAGTSAQKLATMDIDAMVITGAHKGSQWAHINISHDGVKFSDISSEENTTVTETIEGIRKECGEESGIIGIGKSGEALHPIATLFSTYPNKLPYFYCARRAMGDVFGSKRLKAISFTTKNHFDASVEEKELFREKSKDLSNIIINNPVCGGALPAFGSITLINMMKSGKINDMLEKLESMENSKAHGEVMNINRTCSPLCVVGCLNRHAKNKEEFFLSPAESEVHAALQHSLNVDNMKLASELNGKAFEYGIDSVELTFSIGLLFKILDIAPTYESILDAVEEIKNNTLMGKVLGTGTKGIYDLYKEREEFKELVTKPSVSEEKDFKVQFPNKLEKLKDMEDMDYLYANMIAFENMGFCLFTIFALIEDENALKLLEEMCSYKLGVSVTKEEIIEYARECLVMEESFDNGGVNKEKAKNIPEFVKVLYRYYQL